MHFEVKINFSRKEKEELEQLVLQYNNRLITATELCNKVAFATLGCEVQSINNDGSITLVVLSGYPLGDMGAPLPVTAVIHPSTPE